MRILSQFSEEEDHARLEPLGVLPATGQVKAGQLPVPLPAPVERHTHHLLPGLTGRLGVGQPSKGVDRGGDDAETVVAGVTPTNLQDWPILQDQEIRKYKIL